MNLISCVFSFVRSNKHLARSFDECIESFTFLAKRGTVVSLVYIGTSRSLTLLLMLGARESERPPSGTVRCVGLSGCDSAM